MSDIYQKCSRCQDGKLKKYPFSRKFLTTLFVLLVLAPAAFLVHAGVQILAAKLANKALSIHDFCMLEAAIAGGALFVLGYLAHYEYGVLRHLKAWFRLVCPYCENGYLLKNRVGIWRALVYFFDIFLFEQILVPMYQALTLQMVWARDKRPRALWLLPKLLFYIFLFFGSVPFLVYLLGQNKVAGLVFSVLVMLYICYMIFASSDKERSYQKSIVFLLIPLYYVSMVELFRWTWVFSSASLNLLPDESDFMLMGLENLVRTQLFFDVFEVYGMHIGDIQATSFLSYSAIFVTRLLLDVALISMLVAITIKCYRRAWVFKFTGQKSEQVTASESLLEMENVAVLGSPHDIGKMQKLVDHVVGVLAKTGPYVASVARVAGDAASKQAAEHCSRVVKQLAAGSTEEAEATAPGKLRWRTRFAALFFVTLWVCAFTWGIDIFIKDVTQREIRELMALAQKPELQQNPLLRQNIYLKVIRKDSKHREALMASAKTYLEVADLHAKLFDFDQTLIDIDKSFQQMMKLEAIVGKGQPELLALAAQSYIVRSKVFFMQKDWERAASELQKIRTEAYPDQLFTLRAYQAAQALYTPDTAKTLATAERSLGTPKPDKTAMLSLLRALDAAGRQDMAAFLRELELAVGNDKLPAKRLRSLFALCLGETLTRQGKEQFAAAEKYLRQSLQEQASGEVLLALSYLYRLQPDSGKMQESLQPVLADASLSPLMKLRARLQLASALWAANKKEEALIHVQECLAVHTMRDSLRKAVVEFLQGQGDAETLLAGAQSWNMATAERQKCIVSFYIGLRSLGENNISRAVEALRQCVSLGQTSLPEYYQARLELETLQIATEGKSYQSELFLDPAYLQMLAQAVKDELGTIYTQQETGEALAFILGTEYSQEKSRALAAINQREALSGERYLPLLQKGLTDSDNEVKLAALEGLFKIGLTAKTLKNAVIATLQNEDEKVRRAAVKVMSRFGAEAADALEKALHDSDRYVRRDAAYALAQLGAAARPTLATLEAALLDKEIMVRDAALAAVKEIKPEGGAVLARFLDKDTSDAELRLLVLKELEASYPQLVEQAKGAIVPLLVKILLTSDDAQSSRFAAARLVMLHASDQHLPKSDVLPKLLARMRESLGDSDAQRRLRAALLFLQCRERWQEDAAPAFAVFFEAWDKATAGEAQKIVAALLHPENLNDAVVELLAKATTHATERVREAGWQGLRGLMQSDSFTRWAQPVVAAIVRELSAQNEAVKESAPEFFKQCVANDAKVAVPVLLPFLMSDSETVRAAVSQALQQEEVAYQPSEAENDVLLKALGSATEIQKMVLQAIYQLKVSDAKFYPELNKFLDSDDHALCAAAVKALCRYSDHKDELRPKLLALLERKAEAKPKENEEGKDKEEGESGEKGEGDSSLAELKEAVLLTLGVFDGLDALYQLCEKQPELQKTVVDVILPVRALLGEDDSKAVSLFTRFLASQEKEVVESALEEMEKIKENCKPALAALKKLQKSDEPEIRKAVHKFLLQLSPADYDLKSLSQLLGESDLRPATLPVLMARGKDTQIAITAVLACVEDEAVDVRQQAGQLLAQMGAVALPGLLKLTENSKPEVRISAVQAIGLMEVVEARQFLDKLFARLATANPELGEAILEVVAKVVTLKDRQVALKPLQQVAQNAGSSEKTRVFAWFAIAQLGFQSKALPEVTRLLEESHDNQKLIIEVLQKIDATYTANYLAQAIQQRYGKLSAVVAINSLQAVTPQTPQSLQALEEASEDANPRIREAATMVLQVIRKQ
jgi:HEAT repeat protein